MANPTDTNAIFVDGNLSVEVKGTIGGVAVNLTSYTTRAISASFSPLGGYNLAFKNNENLSGATNIYMSLRSLLAPQINGYSESIVTQRGIQAYTYEMDYSSTIDVTQLAPSLYRYSISGFKLSGKASHGDDTREVTGKGFVLLNELIWPF
ncbi:hypothetical protein [Pseudomonas sp. PB106]|uniref:hypothetical protein n=1 Tax=Pseudomonas sp. PB106 TaxID=2494699 RepID=UPI00131E9B06|nr:hypothetical protein [Pseudomonas sp. PB106]KAE9638699.1 hypothetical protein EJA71_27275 [Pseudomonas sp. PB106]